MKTSRKEAAVSKLVARYARHLAGLDDRGLRAEWDAVFGDEFPGTPAEALDVLTQDYEEWMSALEVPELEAVWEDLMGSPVRVTDQPEKKKGKKTVA